MVKVGGYILGEFGNLIAGDSRSRYSCMLIVYTCSLFSIIQQIRIVSLLFACLLAVLHCFVLPIFYYSPLVQFQLLHSRFHLCSAPTRGLLLSTYVKFINLFPEIKTQIQEVSIYYHPLYSCEADLCVYRY